jgi:hypothetical protein
MSVHRRIAPAIILAAAVLAVSVFPQGGTPPVSAGPTVLQVDRTDDDPAASACTPAPNDCSLRGAVINSNSDVEAQTIEIPAGDYGLTTPGTGEEAALTGDLDILFDVTITGAGAATTSIGANQLDRVFDVRQPEEGVRSVTISGLTITGGLVVGGGGGIRSEFSDLTLTDVVIAGNSATYAGAMEIVGCCATMTETTVIKNGATGLGAGGIYANSTTLTVSDSTFNANYGNTGAIDNAGGTLHVTNSTFSGNQATLGGAAIVTNSNTTLTNVTISDNSVTPPALDAQPAGESIGGGGLASYAPFGQVAIKDTIIANNTDGLAGNPDCAGAVSSLGHNLIETVSSGCDLTGITDSNITGDDPMLGDLGDNGGPTQTHALLEGSPAIDAGSEDCPPPNADQRGTPRPQGSTCDIGAFEVEQPSEALWGDGDCGGAVNLGDAIGIARHLVSLPVNKVGDCPDPGESVTADGVARIWQDIDCSGTVSLGDAIGIARHLVSLPVNKATEDCPDIGATVVIE